MDSNLRRENLTLNYLVGIKYRGPTASNDNKIVFAGTFEYCMAPTSHRVGFCGRRVLKRSRPKGFAGDNPEYMRGNVKPVIDAEREALLIVGL